MKVNVFRYTKSDVTQEGRRKPTRRKPMGELPPGPGTIFILSVM